MKISWAQLLASVPKRRGTNDLSGLSGSSVAYAVASIYRMHRLPMMVVLDTAKAAEQFVSEVDLFLKDVIPEVHYFPAYNILPFKFMAYHNETAARRVQTLYKILETAHAPVVVTTVGALLHQLVPKSELIAFGELLMVGEEIDRDRLVRKLIAGGYGRATIVEEVGDFGVRGGILDVYTPLYADPVRIELFGDLVESIRLFSPDTQRTLRSLEEVVILPAREAIVPLNAITEIVARIRAQAAELGLPVTQTRETVQRIKAEGVFPGMESLLPLIYPQLDTLLDYLPAKTLAVLVEAPDLVRTAEEIEVQIRDNYQRAKDQQRLCVDPASMYLPWSQLQKGLADLSPLSIKALPLATTARYEENRTDCHAQVGEIDQVQQALQSAAHTEKPFQPLLDWLADRKREGCTTVFVCHRPSNLKRLQQILTPYGIRANIIEALSDVVADQSRVYLISGPLHKGFVWPEAAMAFISDEEIFGIPYRPRKSTTRAKAAELLNIEDLKQGDIVVHNEHGLGGYQGLVKLRIDRSVNDYLLIVYKDEDKLYLPVERMNLVQKYMGVEGVVPVLDKMGGATWDRVKRKVKRSTEKMAGELLKLYAARKVQKGHAFGSVDTYFQDFEDGFAFEETEDQRKAIENVLEDMRRPTPMDRLVCGDVGYGKTEVALRAAFLAVSEAKQVAVLVPTTVLAEQHYATFSQRFKRYPVKIAALSRFRPAKEQRRIIAELQHGTVDIVVGTHRLLQKDIEFKELGLLVLDEEQRFGVRHKEKIKRLRTVVDVLTLTATPIPRTLHLSLLGVRDISLISTPPEQRRPIVTYLSEFDDNVITDAIRKELGRGGQIFFVHNNIHSIERMAAHLQALVPEVRLAVAHGRMPDDALERVMLDFSHGQVDMLVCTTIIESGLDVTAANTILINRADHFGLAQIYQLRGRVGRADEQAYAYLFISSETALTKDAQKRLKVLMEYSDLGSGFQIAMSDLKIRGGGTILGASQSGHIAAVGYDMFLKLMETSVAEIKGEPVAEDLEPEINLPLSAFLPESYIADIDQRLSVYRRLARMTDLKSISILKSELEDRFGRLPEEAGNLLLKIMLKVLAVRAGCKRLDLANGHLQLQFSEAYQKRPFGIVEMITADQDRYRLTPDHIFKTTLGNGGAKAQLSQTKNILIDIARHVN